ncbi:1,4-dihydroxy-2-naphthoate polyprenyltransferase [Rubrivirga marina]|uniref:1,4-dihydroxy-2-naphthoate polyprenyltransferase n=1 Tax=Rubrivirga marina TaxID=1196024 RepID=UPI001C52EE12|nr:1,4-dihydroxy-2-naphthoate polyprenyltransferase [Rubrivirga marina]
MTDASPTTPSASVPRWRVWLDAARPKTLPAAIAPVLVGIALAVEAGAFHALAATCALLGAVLIQVGTNYANDAEDFVRGADTAARKGPTRATAAGLVTAGQMRTAAAVAFGLAFAAGIALILRGGWPILAVGLASIASGYAYTAGRYALAYTGLADLFVLVFFGPVAVGGTYYVQALDLPGWVPIAGLGPGFLATAILLANNVRDVEEDRAADKRTLVVRFGRPFGVRLYNHCISGAVVVPAALALVSRDHLGVLAAAVLAALLGRRLVRTLATTEDPAVLNPLLGKTAGLLFLYSVTFALGWVLT